MPLSDPLPFRLKVAGIDKMDFQGIRSISYRVEGLLHFDGETILLEWAVHTEARTPILLHLFVYDAIGFVVTVIAVVSGVLNTFGWGIVGVYLFFTVGSGYLLLARPAAAPA